VGADWNARRPTGFAAAAPEGLLTDYRAEESWSQRLQVAEILLNHPDPDLDRRAIETAVAALDYAIQPWYGMPRIGTGVRRQAALILGRLDPIYFDAPLFERLRRVMEEDKSEEVRDAAYQSLLRMATAPRKAKVTHITGA
jgi:HEAT repeat protein